MGVVLFYISVSCQNIMGLEDFVLFCAFLDGIPSMIFCLSFFTCMQKALLVWRGRRLIFSIFFSYNSSGFWILLSYGDW